ncbi:MAG: RIP metalloprotease RseP [Acidobacteria bacterium RBG_16_68_9]|nr:MAG: RIP metalloprotease RseP [Acidobacteria bacterium RBG_16_68_9]
MPLYDILWAICGLGFLIVVHELGHFIFAKRLGVGVLKFSVGFGPRLFGRTVNGTEYALSAVPLGGYVKMVGEDPDAGGADVDPRVSFNQQPLWKRAAIVLAGPGFNILGAFLIFASVFVVYGARVPSEAAKVGGVMEDMPAEQAGLQVGDVVTALDGTPVRTWEELSAGIRASGGREVALGVQRGETTLTVRVTPQSKPDKSLFGEVVGEAFVIGIERGLDQEDVGVVRSLGMAANQTFWWIQTLVLSVVKMVQGKISTQEIGGPILIAQAAGQQARMGLEYFLHFMAVISINLGILNLLPIPILDGGHLLFCVIEAVLRRPLKIRHREIAQQIGLVILVGLMAFAFYNDIARVVRGWG